MNLFFTDGHKQGEKYEISPPGISIGRELDNDVILELEGASRYHAKLFLKDADWFIKDLGSTNGTKLNSEKITPNTDIKLKEGDNIRIGKQTMCFAEKLSDVKAPDIQNPEEMNPGSDTIEPSAVTVSNIEPSNESPKDEKEGSAAAKPFLSFFDKKEDKTEGEISSVDKLDFFGKPSNANEDKNNTSRKKHAGMLFYVAVLGAAVILIAGFLIVEQSKERKPAPTTTKKNRKGAPLLLLYEKQVTSSQPKPNIFRFLMEIKDGTVTITRDDLQAGLKDQPSRKIGPEKLLELEDQLQETDFMATKQGQAGLPKSGEDRQQKLTIAFGKEMNSIVIKNTSPPRAFEEAVRVLEDFSENVLNIRAISLTPEELREDGMNAYTKGKLLFDNYRAQNENLFMAIKHFNVAIENLASFQPEPPEYKEAYKLKNEAERILQDQVQAHSRNAQRYRQLGDFLQAKEEWMAVMAKTAPGSKAYNTARKYVITLEPLIRKKRK